MPEALAASSARPRRGSMHPSPTPQSTEPLENIPRRGRTSGPTMSRGAFVDDGIVVPIISRSPPVARSRYGDSHMNHTKPPQADGLYDPRFEHDACGVAMVARLDNEPTHEVVERALEALDNLEHRGAEGADVRTGRRRGDPRPAARRASSAASRTSSCPTPGRYGVGVCFLPNDATHREQIEQLLERNVRAEGQIVLGWRDVPIDEAHVGDSANACRPHIRQVFVEAGPGAPGRPGRLRAQALRHPPHRRARGRPGLLLAELLLAHVRVQGDAHLPPAPRLLPRPARRAVRAAAWRSCTRASRRTRSRAGSSPIRTA